MPLTGFRHPTVFLAFFPKFSLFVISNHHLLFAISKTAFKKLEKPIVFYAIDPSS
jgi:hypothetical protein